MYGTKPERSKSTDDIAEILDVDASTIQRWVAAGLPHDKGKGRSGNRFNEGEVIEWATANKKTGKPGRPQEPGSADMQAVKLAVQKEILAKYKRENEVAQGLLIDAAEVERKNVLKVVAVRNRLAGLGATLSPQLDGLDGAERQSLIDDATNAICTEFSKA